jgi:heme-degrading monooxygenase HmoA
MVIERAELLINDGQEDAFEAAFADARKHLEDAAGSRSVTIGRGVEHPSKYVLLIEWDSVDAHVAFTQTEAFGQFGGAVGQYFAGKPAMEHFAPR